MRALTPIGQRWRGTACRLASALLVVCFAPTLRAQPAAPPITATPLQLQQCLAGLQATAEQARVSAETWRRHTTGLQPDPRPLELLDNQPEFRLPIWDYLAVLVDEQRIADGRARLAEHRATLQKVAERYGVDAETVVAVWGVESDYGQGFGRFELIPSLATLSCFGRRQTFFRGELFALLRIVQAGDLSAERLVGSWAGAFGHTQFMPSTYERLAVDMDGDGRRDLVGSIPDALGSTAHFLDKAGWRTGEPWGLEVRWPALADPYPMAGEGRRAKKPLAHWVERGFRRTDGSPLLIPGGTLNAQTPAGLIAPAGPRGPAFLVLRNFDALFSYNAAESYGLAIAHLADRLRGGSAFATAWPTDDLGLSRREARELQTLLIARGHEIGEPDGRLGARSRAAVKVEQERLRTEPTGRAGQKLLQALRDGR
jgi:lytic murein transglycosylase